MCCAEVETSQKVVQVANNQVKKLEQALEHEKQLKTEVSCTRIFVLIFIVISGV